MQSLMKGEGTDLVVRRRVCAYCVSECDDDDDENEVQEYIGSFIK